MKAVIIDDEKLIREGLVTYIDWASLGIEICAVCANGTEGMQAVIEQRPQIILADICLPDFSGLDMFGQISSYGFKCEIIFISSYSEFKYAQQAVKLGAFDYLLKPIEADTLYDCVRRCVKKISMSSNQAPALHNRPFLEKLLKDALTNVPQVGSTFLRLVHQSGISDDALVFLAVSEKRLEWLENKMYGEKINPILTCYEVFLADKFYVYCFFTDYTEGESRTERFLHSVCGIQAVVLRVAVKEGDAPLYTCFQKALAYLILRERKFEGQPLLYEEKKHKLALQLIQNPTPERVEQALYQFFASCVQKQWGKRYLDFQFECCTFLENIYKQLSEYYGMTFSPEIDIHILIDQLRESENIYDLFFDLCSIVVVVFDEIRQNCGHSPYTRKALAVIRNRYGENLSLKSVAKELHVSSSYLSVVFKEDMGCPFSEYLFQYRMNQALALVKEGRYRIYEIGERVGYPDIAQFSKNFKKQFGYSPKQIQGGMKKA